MVINNKNIKSISKTLDITKNNINLKIQNNNNYNQSLLSIYIYNYPSLKEIKKVLSDYCLLNNINLNSNKKIIITPLLNNSIRNDFPNEKILQGFNSYLYLLKPENISFKNIIIKKSILISKFRLIDLPNNFSFSNINNKNYDNNLKSVISNKKKLIIKNIIKIIKHDKNYNNNNLIEDNKIINEFYSKRNYIRNGSPYLSDEEKRKIGDFKNKSKFINNKGFFTSVGKYSMPIKDISNYVQMSPSENPSTYKFRNVDKLKWITKKGFIN